MRAFAEKEQFAMKKKKRNKILCEMFVRCSPSTDHLHIRPIRDTDQSDVSVNDVEMFRVELIYHRAIDVVVAFLSTWRLNKKQTKKFHVKIRPFHMPISIQKLT